MSHFKKILICFLLITTCIMHNCVSVHAGFSYVILSSYYEIVDIGDEFYIAALTSTGKKPVWKTSNSKCASVNTYGKITARHSGTAYITAKIKGSEAVCQVNIRKTKILLNQKAVSLENGQCFQLTGTTSNNSLITWKSSRKSIAAVNEHGYITALKPGETIITAKADDTKLSCRVTVKKPVIHLSRSSVRLYRNKQVKLTAQVSSKRKPVWKSTRKSIAYVNENGSVTAVKHGTTEITATVDGVTARCNVTVKQPKVKLSKTEVTLKKGTSLRITADVSSGNSPRWSSSNTAVATVSNGMVTTHAKGKATIYASEDGIKAKCSVKVTN